jgi:lysophospholipase L1-like esterase
LTGTVDLTDGKWHHIVAKRNAATNEVSVYVDGQKNASAIQAFTSGFSSSASLNIGHILNANYFVGDLDEVALYNKALSDEEITRHYYDGIAGLRMGYCNDCSGPVSIMPLGDSLTSGYGAITDDNYRVSYRQKLYRDLAGAGYAIDFVGNLRYGALAVPSFDVDNEGRPGYHAQGGTQGDIASNVYNWLVANPSDVVLLHIGTNDISVSGQNATEVATILNEIDRYSPDVTVILARIIKQIGKEAVTTQFNNDVVAMAQTRIAAGDKIIVVDQENALTYLLTADMYDSVCRTRPATTRWPMCGLGRCAIFCPRAPWQLRVSFPPLF